MRTASLALLSIGGLTLSFSFAPGQVAFSRYGGLTTVVPGINDEASDTWLASAAAITPTSERWVIREAGVGPYKHLTQVGADHIITIGTTDSPEAIKQALAVVAGKRDVTVVVDMKLGWNVTEAGWTPHTKWASVVSETLAESHAKHFPDARNLYIGHSAGTEPVAMMPASMPDLRKGASGKDRRLYDDIMVLSGRRSPEDPGYPKWAVLAFADGDFYSNPKGKIDRGSVLKTYGEAEAIAFDKQGYSVVRIVENNGATWASALILATLPVGAVAAEMANRKQRHTESTEMSIDLKTMYYAPKADVPIAMPTTTLANVLKVAVDVEGGRTTDVQGAVSQIKSRGPTAGIGGISLNAGAFVPVDPNEIEYAGYSAGTSSLFLKLKNGKLLRLPSLEAEAVRQSYDTVFLEGKKAELSITSRRATSPEGNQVLDLRAPGNSSVYYFGKSQDTLLGLLMYRADEMQGQLAFTTSPAVREVASRVPGFHSLVELFPEKYSNHPAREYFSDSDGRIFLTTKTVVLKRSQTRPALDFGEFAVSIHFGHNGPAEAAYAAFFEANLAQILKTKNGSKIADLIPYARASAVFRWMRDNRVRFVPGPLGSIAVRRVFTPNATEINFAPDLADVSVKPPTVFFGLSGPTRVVRANGSESSITYSDGRLSEVRRYDGQILRVYRDSVGMPVAVQWLGHHAVAFMNKAKVGLVLAKNVEIKSSAVGESVLVGRTSTFYPIVNPDCIVAGYAIRFANGENNL